MWILNNGVATPEGDVVVVDQDKLCYLVKNTSHGASGLRTISKAIVEEFVLYLEDHRETTVIQAKDALVGRSEIDKFEYGYNATLVKMARLILEHRNDPEYVSVVSNKSFAKVNVSPESLQQIYYGAPGTGKSHTIDEMTNKDNSIRTTFHPDSDYASFVGAYKPTMETHDVYALDATGQTHQVEIPHLNQTIVYKYIPQSFIKAYVKAWELYVKDESPYYLVIEEINRGNCAQIFGDLFQLLDRSDNGFSSYANTPDIDIQKFLAEDERGFLNLEVHPDEEIINDNGKVIATFKDIKDGSLMVLPPNLHILATMNTSDQSLFPIDSAFKRRWDWVYMKIKDAGKKWQIEFQTDAAHPTIDWWEFVQKINSIIADMTSSADKQLGYFFCKADKKVDDSAFEATIISKEKFVGKVLFYLWNDVFKDYGFDDADLFRYIVKDDNGREIEKDITFPDFYDDGNQVNDKVVVQFIENVLKWDKNAKA